MEYKNKEIKEGINLHMIQTNNFKTNLLSVFLTTPLLRETVTKEALIGSVIRRGSKNMPSTEQISKNLEEMYGASFDCGIEKIGDNHVLKFYLEAINDEFLPQEENILKKAIDTLLEIVFEPLSENGEFKQEYVKTEKENLKQIIEGKIDNKAKYAQDRCIEEMYKDKPYGLYKFGYVEDLEKITSKELYEYYKKMLKECKIDIFISGKIDTTKTKQIIETNETITNLQGRKILINKGQNLENVKNPEIIEEKLEVTQGKLVLGLNIENTNLDEKYIAMVYNTILGGGANSKLFQNVREKASLAYTAGSSYIRQKNNIIIRCGIEIANYSKALEIIKKQIEDMKKGEFTQKDLDNAKQNIISAIKFIPDEQDTQITYYFGQVIAGSEVSLEEYIKRIERITKEQIIELAKKVNINIIYFLTQK